MLRQLNKWADEARTLPGYARLVKRFAAGPSRLSPFAIGPVERAANLTEFFVHTEDIRRAHDTWAPRVLDRAYAERLWSALTRVSHLMFRRAGVGVILVRPDGTRHVARKGNDSVAINGDAPELLMYAFGRRDHALVTFEGSAEAIARLTEAHTAH